MNIYNRVVKNNASIDLFKRFVSFSSIRSCFERWRTLFAQVSNNNEVPAPSDPLELRALKACFFTGLLKAASFCKMSFIICSHIAFFSATSVVMPLTGVFSGMAGSCAVVGLGCILKMLCSGLLSFTYLVYHIPGLFAAWYLASNSWVVRLLVPLLCVIAFVAHPVGGQAWVYTLYWFVPVALYYARKKQFFFQALGSTFTAHAVGSIVYLYLDPMTPEVWLGLVPVVAVERLMFAAGITMAYKAVVYVQRMAKYKLRGFLPC